MSMLEPKWAEMYQICV